MADLATLDTSYGTCPLPTFFPDGTRGVVRAVDAQDLERCGIQGIVVNTLHLANTPGTGLIKSQGGIHDFMGWQHPIISDSGGFQAMSMIRENARYGTIATAGITFTNVDVKGKPRLKLTPEKSIQIQFALGSDIMICLDDCPHPQAGRDQVVESVQRTVAWAKRCKAEFERQVENRHLLPRQRPRLFGVIQGGFDRALRKQCADQLLAIGFDGYGFGGWPLDGDGRLAEEILACTADLMSGFKYALGVGSPENIVRCVEMGYQIFDCVLPTRDARHHRLYCFNDPADPFAYSFLYIQDEQYKRDARPLSEWCDCPCCTHYSRSYLHHLFDIRDTLALRLATMHNLRFYAQLMSNIRQRLALKKERE
ncbi:MAG: queuine tRNA-ribosyltransferase family protein [Anaerolineae bacterium]|nr:queuine tRNA-ribosyltransferase family protein [Anaerolineae bacterium]